MAENKSNTKIHFFIIGLFLVAAIFFLIFIYIFNQLKIIEQEKDFSQGILALIPKSEKMQGFLPGPILKITGESFALSGVNISWKEVYSVSYKTNHQNQPGTPFITINFARYPFAEIELVNQLFDLFEYQSQGYVKGEILITPNIKIEEPDGIIIEKLPVSIMGERVVAVKYFSESPEHTYHTIMFYKKDLFVILLMYGNAQDFNFLFDIAQAIEQKI